MNQPDLFQDFPTQEAAHEAFERHRGGWLKEARLAGQSICWEAGSATVDDVRERCPPPDDVDSRIMGTVFKHRAFRPLKTVTSKRAICHHRPIVRFVLTGLPL